MVHFHPHTHGSGDSHDHDHSHPHPGSDAEIPRSLWRALGVTLIFMMIEAVGGVIANSLALLSDAAHMLTDSGAMLLSLFVFWMARRPSTPHMSFGYHRAEILGALASGLLIWGLAGFLVYEAIRRLSAPPDVKGPIVFVIAGIGLMSNLISMALLHRAKTKNLNVKAAYLHVMADSMGSVGAMIAGGVLWWTGWNLIDPIMTLVLAALMLVSSWSLVKEAVGILMESTPSGIDPKQVQMDLGSLQGIQEVHDLHIWSVASRRYALSVHIISRETERTLTLANELLQHKYGIVHTTIQVEHPEKFDSARCYDCASV